MDFNFSYFVSVHAPGRGGDYCRATENHAINEKKLAAIVVHELLHHAQKTNQRSVFAPEIVDKLVARLDELRENGSAREVAVLERATRLFDASGGLHVPSGHQRRPRTHRNPL